MARTFRIRASNLVSIRSPADSANLHLLSNYNPRAARDLLRELIAAGNALASFPERGRPVDDGLRELTVIYPYLIRYEIRGGEVHIIRVRHGAQRPS